MSTGAGLRVFCVCVCIYTYARQKEIALWCVYERASVCVCVGVIAVALAVGQEWIPASRGKERRIQQCFQAVIDQMLFYGAFQIENKPYEGSKKIIESHK